MRLVVGYLAHQRLCDWLSEGRSITSGERGAKRTFCVSKTHVEERNRSYCAVRSRLPAVCETLGKLRPSRRFSEVLEPQKTAWSLHYNPTISRSETAS